MKRSVMVVTLLVILTAAAGAKESPLDKGSMILGGQISYMNQSGNLYGDGVTTYSVTPQIGQFVAPGVLLGVILDVYKQETDDEEFSSYGFGPVVGYYFGAGRVSRVIKGSLYPTIQAFAIFGEGNSIEDYTRFELGGFAGFDYMLTHGVALQVGVQVRYDMHKIEGASSSSHGTSLMARMGIEAFVW